MEVWSQQMRSAIMLMQADACSDGAKGRSHFISTLILAHAPPHSLCAYDPALEGDAVVCLVLLQQGQVLCHQSLFKAQRLVHLQQPTACGAAGTVVGARAGVCRALMGMRHQVGYRCRGKAVAGRCGCTQSVKDKYALDRIAGAAAAWSWR